MRERVPEFGAMGPVWWDIHGSKMRVTELDIESKRLVIAAAAAEVVISPMIYPETAKSNPWQIDWRVVYNYRSGEETRGRVGFREEELEIAFGLSDVMFNANIGHRWIDQYGATTCAVGKFIRYQDFLNIPSPDAGVGRSHTVSIELDAEIKKAVHSLIFPHQERLFPLC